MGKRTSVGCVAVAWVALIGSVAGAQPYGGPTTQPAYRGTSKPTSAPAAAPTTSFKPEELEQIVAPIALYPDALLAQIFMASTYPLEIVQADRWVKQNPTLKDSPEELNKQTWDPSVKSLIDVPQVLTMMSEKLDWTVKLGDAFIANQKALMDAVQRLRAKAYAQGNLKDSKEQKVVVEQVPATTTQPSSQVIVVQSSQPSVVYVPTYNPTVVYGGWPYPAYPPAYYYPPGYVAAASVVSFGVGMAVGAAWGHAWGDCDWHGGDVDIDVNKNINYNQNINREKVKNEYNNRAKTNGGKANTFQHDPSHRQGVGYRDAGTTERYRGQGASRQTSQARDSYRGRTQAGPSDLSRGGVDSLRGGSGTGSGARTANRTPQTADRSRQASGARSSGFGGVDSGGASARAASNRGQQSRSSPNYSRSSAARSGGGGGSRGGGGRGGGRR